jgi:hypothetical protein
MDAVKDNIVYPQGRQPPGGPLPVTARSAPVNNFQYQARSALPSPTYQTNVHPLLPPPPKPPPTPPPSQPPVVTGPLPPPTPPPKPTRTPVQQQDMATSQGWFLFFTPCKIWC